MERPEGAVGKQPQRTSATSLAEQSSNATNGFRSARASPSGSDRMRKRSKESAKDGETRKSTPRLISPTPEMPNQGPDGTCGSKSTTSLSGPSQTLTLLRKELDHMRQLITCNICYDLLYEPFTTACGHTYCYACLCQFFISNRSTQCPECRTRLRHPPAPAYLVREITHSFIRSPDLLAPGENLAELKEKQARFAAELQHDKTSRNRKTGGLFKGRFRKRNHLPRPIRDPTDGVDRCPYCNWEIEDGMCMQCHLPFDAGGEGDWTDNANGFDENDDLSVSSGATSSFNSSHPDDLDGDELVDMEYDEGNFDDVEAENDWHDRATEFYGPDHVNEAFGVPTHIASRYSHSDSSAGRRRSSYAGSLTSGATGSEMDTVEEEDEDEDETEDEAPGSEDERFIDDEMDDTSVSGLSSSDVSGIESEQPLSPMEAQQIGRDETPGRVSSRESSVPMTARRQRGQILGRRRRPVIDEDSTPGSTPGATPIPQSPGGADTVTRQSRHPLTRRRGRVIREDSNGSSTDRSLSNNGPSFSPVVSDSSVQGSQPRSQSLEDRGGDEQIEEEDSDGGDSDGTTVGLANSPSFHHGRNERSLTPNAADNHAFPRPYRLTYVHSRLPGSRHALHRHVPTPRTINRIHDEDTHDRNPSVVVQNDNLMNAAATVQHRQSIIHIRQHHPETGSTRVRTLDDSDESQWDSDESSECSPVSDNVRSRREPQSCDPRIRLLLMQQERVLRHNFEPSVAAELREMLHTPLMRPPTANRHRLNAQPSRNRLHQPSSIVGWNETNHDTPASPTIGLNTVTLPRRPSLNSSTSLGARQANSPGLSGHVRNQDMDSASNTTFGTRFPSSAGRYAGSDSSHTGTPDRPHSRATSRLVPAARHPSISVASTVGNHGNSLALGLELSSPRVWQPNNPFNIVMLSASRASSNARADASPQQRDPVTAHPIGETRHPRSVNARDQQPSPVLRRTTSRSMRSEISAPVAAVTHGNQRGGLTGSVRYHPSRVSLRSQFSTRHLRDAQIQAQQVPPASGLHSSTDHGSRTSARTHAPMTHGRTGNTSTVNRGASVDHAARILIEARQAALSSQRSVQRRPMSSMAGALSIESASPSLPTGSGEPISSISFSGSIATLDSRLLGTRRAQPTRAVTEGTFSRPNTAIRPSRSNRSLGVTGARAAMSSHTVPVGTAVDRPPRSQVIERVDRIERPVTQAAVSVRAVA